MAEEVLRDDAYRVTKEQLKGIHNYPGLVKIMKAICKMDALYQIYLKLLDNKNLRWPFLERQRKLRQKAYDNEKAHEHELTSEQEIQEIIRRIRNAEIQESNI